MKSIGIKVKSGKSTLVLHASKLGLHIGKNGEARSPGAFFGTLTKGEARKVRKALRANGFLGYAAQPRCHVGVLEANTLVIKVAA